MSILKQLYLLFLKHASGTVEEGIYLNTLSDGKKFNLFHLKAKKK